MKYSKKDRDSSPSDIIEFSFFQHNVFYLNSLWSELPHTMTSGDAISSDIEARLDSYFTKVPSYYYHYLAHVFHSRRLGVVFSKKWKLFTKYGCLHQNNMDLSKLHASLQQALQVIASIKQDWDREADRIRTAHYNGQSECCSLARLRNNTKTERSQAADFSDIDHGLSNRNKLLELVDVFNKQFEELALSEGEEESQLSEKQKPLKGEHASRRVDTTVDSSLQNKPIGKLYDYSAYLKKNPEFRDPSADEEEIRPKKEPIPFGNPFKYVYRHKSSSEEPEFEDEAFMTSLTSGSKMQIEERSHSQKRIAYRIEDSQRVADEKMKDLKDRASSIGTSSGAATPVYALRRKESDEFSFLIERPRPNAQISADTTQQENKSDSTPDSTLEEDLEKLFADEDNEAKNKQVVYEVLDEQVLAEIRKAKTRSSDFFMIAHASIFIKLMRMLREQGPHSEKIAAAQKLIEECLRLAEEEEFCTRLTKKFSEIMESNNIVDYRKHFPELARNL